MRHNDPTDFLASCMKELHHDVEVEPPLQALQSLTGETFHYRSANTDPDARADLWVKGFWADSHNAFFDTRVFYPHVWSYRSKSLPSLYRRFEDEKKRAYGERVNEVEHDSFTPLVFSSCGGMGSEAAVVVKRLAHGLATKRNAGCSLAAVLLRIFSCQICHPLRPWITLRSPSSLRPRGCRRCPG